ncbi:proline--tRNA ligase [Bradyrhizobium sp.]|jgi:prolyl-tRNA synthetase|uniref:proline--tRNA ligase n=1 Tax=Bradyrhizobium sp. TaxID=376 RepID=UPI002E08C845|nr:proline--tRNA ligase [Bradyrhizobium sp.]
MKASRFGIRILREFPKDAEAPSHKWLVRSGYIIQHASGIYSYTPLFFRVFRKICAIVEQEMAAIGAQQVQLPLLQPARLWERSGRWEVFRRSRLMFQLTDRKDSQYGLTPTAEEMMCEFAKSLITTRKDVPLTFFQQHVKFRDELRPRFGLVRSREFTMMDAYSFDCDDAGMDAVYRAMRGAYQAVFTRCALKFAIVLADSGAMGGSGSEEFMALSEWGEDTILYTDNYAANAELAQGRVERDAAEPPRPARQVSTPNAGSADDVAVQLGISLRQIVKTLVYEVAAASGEDQLVAVLLRGDRSINLVKLQNHLGGIDAKLAAADKVAAIFGAEPGSIGPVGMRGRIRVLADQSIEGLTNIVVGANKTGWHLADVNIGRDFEVDAFADLQLAEAGDIAADGAALSAARGIEVGHIFKLGDKYTRAFELTVPGSDNKPVPLQMGCYGIGTSRVAAAIVEQWHDDDGIIWPVTVAPFEVAIVAIKQGDDGVQAHIDTIETALAGLGLDYLTDDRDISAGAKFKSMDMIGIPFRITLGRALDQGLVEVRARAGGRTETVAIGEAAALVAAWRKAALDVIQSGAPAIAPVN